ncbi:MAG TPA: hypothetical protein PLP23_11105 [Panacibacter sp.]|nr:hypothetical protein [Panacibacter sp.]
MNILQALFCNQYDELVKTGRDGNKARKNGLILCAVCIVLNILTICCFFFWTTPTLTNYLDSASEYLEGKTIGKILFAAAFGVILLILRYSIGTEKHFNSLVSKFNELAEADQKAINCKAMIYCFGSIILFLLVVLSTLLI